MEDGGDRCGAKRRGPQSRACAPSNRSKVPRRDPGASQSCVSDDDFVSTPLTFLARLEQNPAWNAPGDALTSEEDAAFSRIKTRLPTSILVDVFKDLSAQQKADIVDTHKLD
nr:uncharacterized protein LOC109193148 isoform X1 [Ipomoea batatas]